jgi:diguanylate cyclase (GGDEF)-like protein
LMAGNGGTKRVINTKGNDMLASYSYIQEAGWGIVSQTPTDVVLNSTRKLVMKIVLYMLPALLIFMAVIYWIVGKVAAPFSKLAQFATLLSPTQSSSDELPKVNEWNYEANVLHKALARAIRHFRYQFESLSIEAQTDPLTGLFNRRTMDHFVQNWIAQKASFSMLVMDLDNFKQVNDTYGHDMGDNVLKYLASSLQRLFGENHVCCRFGGEEFVVLVLDEDFNKAIEDAESIRKFMAETKSPTGSAVTLSIGVSHYPGFAHNADQLFRLADEAMYRAKRSGRNRVELEQGAGFDSTEKTS